MWGCRTWVLLNFLVRSLLEGSTLECDSHVEEGKKEDSEYPKYISLDMELESTGH